VVLDTTAAVLGTTAAGADPGLVPGTPAAPAASAAAPATTATTATSTATAAPAAATATPTATPMTTPAAPPLAGTAPAIADLPRDAGLTVVLDPTPAPAAGPVVPAADADATVSTDAARTTDLVAAPAPAFGDSPDTGSDGTTGDPETGMAAPAEPTPAADTDSLVTVSGPASVTPADPVAEAAPAAPAGDDAPVATQLGRQFAVLRNAPDGSQTMTVVITPETLGPVTVQVTVTDGSLDLTLHGASEAGRHALLDALPELRRELESAGLTFTRLEVDTSNRDAGAGLRNPEQQLLDARAGQHGSSGQPGQQESRARTWSSAPDRLGAGSAALTTSQSTSSGVDVRV
jgi:flagellar hook-length control protein FliK